MKALSERAANACENATTPHCRCRCGGVFHGAKRVASIAELPATDPHAGPRLRDGSMRKSRTKVLEHGTEPWREEQLPLPKVRS